MKRFALILTTLGAIALLNTPAMANDIKPKGRWPFSPVPFCCISRPVWHFRQSGSDVSGVSVMFPLSPI